jgi:hypothetical protein
MAITFSKLLALLIALAYLVAALVIHPGRWNELLLLAIVLVVPLVLIWFPEIGTRWPPRKKTVLGYYEDSVAGPFGVKPAMRDSPPKLVALMGWFFLIGLPALLFWLSSR